jgi:cytidylate kinase
MLVARQGEGRRVTVILITGIQAAGKSSVAQAVAERLDRSVHVRGDLFRRMIVSGRANMGPADPPDEAVRQLRLRYRLAAQAADGYAEAGFTAVLQDIVLGGYLTEMVAAIRTRPLYVVVLAPRPAVVAEREAARHLARGKTALTRVWTEGRV